MSSPVNKTPNELEANLNGGFRDNRTNDTQTYQSTINPASATDLDADKRRFRQFANPAPLGLCGFALTTFVLSLINVHARSVLVPNIVIGLGISPEIKVQKLTVALAYGGFAQFCAGMWEFACGNTFGALAFTSYGAFWLSFACIFIPFFNIANAEGYVKDKSQLFDAIGHYLMCTSFPLQQNSDIMYIGWGIFTFFLLIGTLRSSVAFFLLFFTLTLAFFMLATGYYLDENQSWIKAGGWFGLMTASLAWYNAVA